ncbi:diguanylate cyclase [Geobacter metallireducens RCH3]|uniref:diguanylate cyclase n=1 Tax=Geobacter metallireducens (strain ATCC 53774 / DSM 7210 / GS-15) TaxID=269799 RepID=Q39SX4_GEOMG|nr:GGDEF domain-containing protein [Geobacter metallireducens]ABB32650.1 diguanylate cyclase [Geobacter metallireducens GS-15]EHP87857.1 diguanylate cyclase [Geobacter metallireducens RCH3]
MLQSHIMAGNCTVKPARMTRAPYARHELKSTNSGCDESPAALERRVAELLLVADFGAVVGSILDPRQVCEVASSWLGETLGWQMLSVCCHDFSTGTMRGGAGRGRHLSKKRQEGATSTVFIAAAQKGLSDAADVRTIPFPDGSGTLSLSRQSLAESQYSDEFFGGVVENLARSLAAARECDRLKNLSMRDHLTGLYNRRVFEAMLEVEARKRTTKPFSLLLIDLDDFKRVNDTYGHGAGDQVLVAVAKMLRLSFRKSDVVSRYGGEEFGVLLPDTSQDSARVVAERFRQNVATLSLPVNKEKIMPTVSVGIASVTLRLGIEVADVIEEADRALYQAKVTGKNRVCSSLLGENS